MKRNYTALLTYMFKYFILLVPEPCAVFSSLNIIGDHKQDKWYM